MFLQDELAKPQYVRASSIVGQLDILWLAGAVVVVVFVVEAIKRWRRR